MQGGYWNPCPTYLVMNNFCYKEVKTNDTYEAAFYILHGGQFAKVRCRELNSRQAYKKGYAKLWTVYVSDVPQWAIDTWRTGQAYGNITSFVDVRNKLKKKIKHELGITNKYSCN